jgi:hypothetical protein
LQDQLAASKAEVERLRAFIKSKLPPPPYGELEPEWEYAEKLLAETAPAPEEPYYPEKDLPTPDEEIAYAKSTEPVPEWRELGPDEEIHTGDQVQAKHHDRLHGVWLDVFPYEVGAMPIDHEAFRYRTRRPLPKQEEERPLGKCVPANPPLEKELHYIERRGTSLPDTRRYIADAIRYLRDEIEQLKKN